MIRDLLRRLFGPDPVSPQARAYREALLELHAERERELATDRLAAEVPDAASPGDRWVTGEDGTVRHLTHYERALRRVR